MTWVLYHGWSHTQKVFEGLDHKNKSDIAAEQSSFELYFQQKFQFSFGSTNLKVCHKTVVKPNEKWSTQIYNNYIQWYVICNSKFHTRKWSTQQTFQNHK